MTHFFNKTSLFTTCFIAFLVVGMTAPEWGFYGHRKINRMAVFTLPQEMIPFFKENLEYVTAHAVDPDKRRHASVFEGIRHYIDVDHWCGLPFDCISRSLEESIFLYSSAYYISSNEEDTTHLWSSGAWSWQDTICVEQESDFRISASALAEYTKKLGLSKYYNTPWVKSNGSFFDLVKNHFSLEGGGQMVLEDEFSEYGILPYHLETMTHKLTSAFASKNKNLILRHASDMGHYLGDAHVPLHTSENYNGQMTNQVGIHPFWESRIPELFADDEFDFLVGQAEYIDDVRGFFWTIVEHSHALVDSVLSIEKRLSVVYPEELQYCYEERLDKTARMPCRDYSEAYYDALNGQVEDQMRSAVHALGSIWYTCWVDAGQPDLEELDNSEKSTHEELRKIPSAGREHSVY